MTPADVPDGVRLVSREDLLAGADLVSVHARATAANWHMFSAAAFAAMKPGAGFINTARESLVDEGALADAVRSGHLAGAALDVVERPAGGGRRVSSFEEMPKRAVSSGGVPVGAKVMVLCAPYRRQWVNSIWL